jgi:hypothetical protein
MCSWEVLSLLLCSITVVGSEFWCLVHTPMLVTFPCHRCDQNRTIHVAKPLLKNQYLTSATQPPLS